MAAEKMRMVVAAEDFVAEVDVLLPGIRSAMAHAGDNLQRSAESALFNTAEGAGAYRPRVKIAAYEVAKKEAHEARAIIHLAVRRQVIAREQAARAVNLAGALIGMLTSACKTLQSRT
ncbi:MAG TPA: four helix bundle protein [Longimicrobiales bacterium]|nr:four helix bundle protein [Longimicrobiales bacterium]